MRLVGWVSVGTDENRYQLDWNLTLVRLVTRQSKMIDVNVKGVIYGTQLAVRRWQSTNKRGGVIINTASAAALREVPDAEVYVGN